MRINSVQNQAFKGIAIDESAAKIMENRFRAMDKQKLSEMITRHSGSNVEITFHDLEHTGRVQATLFERGGSKVVRLSEKKTENERYSPLVFIKRVVNNAQRYLKSNNI